MSHLPIVTSTLTALVHKQIPRQQGTSDGVSGKANQNIPLWTHPHHSLPLSHGKRVGVVEVMLRPYCEANRGLRERAEDTDKGRPRR